MSENSAAVETAPAPSAPATSAPAATSTPAPTPAAATATPAAKPETPTPSRNLSARELLDTLPSVAEKRAEKAAATEKPKAEVPVVTSEAKPTAAPPVESPATPEPESSSSSESAEAATTDKTEAPPEESFDPEKFTPEEIEPAALTEALKGITDKKVRDLIRYEHRVAKLVTRPYSEQKELNSLFPTTEMARQAVQLQQAYVGLADAFHSGSPEGIRHVIKEMATANPVAFQTFVGELAPHLPKINQEAALRSRGAMLDGVIGFFRQEAANTTDSERQHEAATVADILEERFGNLLPSRAGRQPQRSQQPHPAEQQLRALQQRDQELREQARGNFLLNADGLVARSLEKEAGDIVSKSDPNGLYPEDAKAELRDEIRDAILAALDQNPNFVRYINELAANGGFDPDHTKRFVEAKLQAARVHLRDIATEKVEKYARRFNAIQNNKVQRQSEIAARRDVGGSGAPVSAPAPPPIDPKGKSVRELLDLIPRRRA